MASHRNFAFQDASKCRGSWYEEGRERERPEESVWHANLYPLAASSAGIDHKSESEVRLRYSPKEGRYTVDHTAAAFTVAIYIYPNHGLFGMPCL
jgi:hypothetical protein